MLACKPNLLSQQLAQTPTDDSVNGASAKVSHSFDYTSLDAETLAMVQQCTLVVRGIIKPPAKDVITAGETLLAVKHRLGHGRFGPWLEATFGKSSRTAQKFMRVATVFKNEYYSDFFKNEESSFLDIEVSALCYLAEDSTPNAARQEAFNRANGGECITHAMAKAIVNQYKPSSANPKLNSNVECESPDRLPHPPLVKARLNPSVSKAVIDVPAETISVHDTAFRPCPNKDDLSCDRTSHLTKTIRDLTLVEPANSKLLKEPLSAQLSISNIDWHKSRLLNNGQTLKIPISFWVEGPSYVLSALHKQIMENPDTKALIFDKFSVLIKEVAELAA